MDDAPQPGTDDTWEQVFDIVWASRGSIGDAAAATDAIIAMLRPARLDEEHSVGSEA